MKGDGFEVEVFNLKKMEDNLTIYTFAVKKC